MANMMALNTVYNHYLTSYAQNSTSKYDTHKKSELRNIYNTIVKLNKESPLYLPNISQDSQVFAIGLKEGARELHNVIASLGGLDEDELLNKKVAFSSNENMVSAQYIGNADPDTPIPSYEIEVRSLASSQMNLGRFLPSSERALVPGTYSFEVNIHNMNYEFQYNITDADTNLTLQKKLARLISNADIGITASVETQGDLSALCLTSAATGAPLGRDSLFSVSDAHSSKTSGSVAYFGIGEVTRPASNAELLINGIARSASSNHFTLEKTYELTLNGISPVEGQTASISVKNDTESLVENIRKLADGYNQFMNLTQNPVSKKAKTSNLLHEMYRLTSHYGTGLDHAGLAVQADGTLTVNPDAYSQAFETADAKQSLLAVKDFADSLLRKTNQISINPMQYVGKTIVAYKNPGKNFATPYITSAYSGMMFNSYC